MKSRFLVAFLLAATAQFAAADDLDLVHVQLKVFEPEPELGWSSLMGHGESENGSGERLLSSPTLLLQAGKWATVDAVREIVYPTEYDPASVPEEFSENGGEKPYPANKAGTFLPPHPGAFESRDLGLKLQIRPEFTADGSVKVEVKYEQTALKGFVNYGTPITAEHKGLLGKSKPRVMLENQILVPSFQTQKNSFTIEPGDKAQSIQLRPKEGNEEVEFVEFAESLRSSGLPTLRIEVEAKRVKTGLQSAASAEVDAAAETRMWELTMFGKNALRQDSVEPVEGKPEPAAADVAEQFRELGIEVSSATVDPDGELKVTANPAALERIDKLVLLYNDGAQIYITSRYIETDAPIDSEFAKPLMTDADRQVFLRAMNQQRGVDLLSAPSIMARSSQAARIEVVQEFLYPVSYDPPAILKGDEKEGAGVKVFPISPANPTEFNTKSLGVILDIEEVLLYEDSSIQLSFRPQVVEFEGFLNFGESIVMSGKDRIGQKVKVNVSDNEIQAPIFRRREISSTVRIPDGSAVLLGGIVKTSKSHVQDKVPLLGDLPLVGKLARSEVEIESTRYLYIMIQVSLVKSNGQPVAAVQF
ncbi:MAG: hypothetical protein ACI8UO_000549 [Verrucomicrobiales bacterium]|jgi:hypothetical protein